MSQLIGNQQSTNNKQNCLIHLCEFCSKHPPTDELSLNAFFFSRITQLMPSHLIFLKAAIWPKKSKTKTRIVLSSSWYHLRHCQLYCTKTKSSQPDHAIVVLSLFIHWTWSKVNIGPTQSSKPTDLNISKKYLSVVPNTPSNHSRVNSTSTTVIFCQQLLGHQASFNYIHDSALHWSRWTTQKSIKERKIDLNSPRQHLSEVLKSVSFTYSRIWACFGGYMT
jgi:hypothetical protein